MRIRIIPKLLGNSPSKRSKTTYNNLTKILRQRWHSMSFLCPGPPAWICWCSGGPAYNHTITRCSGPAEGGGWGPAVLSTTGPYPIVSHCFPVLQPSQRTPATGATASSLSKSSGGWGKCRECKGICSDYNNQVSIA